MPAARPTTAGDFLRRFNADALTGLRHAIDAVQHKVWSKLARHNGRRCTERSLAVVYLDGHLKALYGNQFEGADFSYKGKLSFNALVVTLAGTGECLRMVKQYVGEVGWTPRGSHQPLRLVVRRQILDRFEGEQGRLTDFIRDRYVVTDLPQSWSVEDHRHSSGASELAPLRWLAPLRAYALRRSPRLVAIALTPPRNARVACVSLSNAACSGYVCPQPGERASSSGVGPAQLVHVPLIAARARRSSTENVGAAYICDS
ncbi:hypothetical protein WMF20_24265 [Sorangium sp. So ce834]|uniref:hypothetical protein n=1 Tax=Sorangium sp. So ce834 TaxID=3133321 RepID=UPI003F6238C7